MGKVVRFITARIGLSLWIESYVADLRELGRRLTEEEIIGDLKSRGAGPQRIRKTLRRLKTAIWHDGKPYFCLEEMPMEVKGGPADLIDLDIERERKEKAENTKAARKER